MPKSAGMAFVLHVPIVIHCLLEHRYTTWGSSREGDEGSCTPPPRKKKEPTTSNHFLVSQKKRNLSKTTMTKQAWKFGKFREITVCTPCRNNETNFHFPQQILAEAICD